MLCSPTESFPSTSGKAFSVAILLLRASGRSRLVATQTKSLEARQGTGLTNQRPHEVFRPLE